MGRVGAARVLSAGSTAVSGLLQAGVRPGQRSCGRAGADAIPANRQLAVDGAGNALWLSTAAVSGNRQVAVYERCASTPWARTSLLGPVLPAALPVGLAVTPAGAALVVYREPAGGSDSKYSSVYRPPGGAWQAPQPIVTGELGSTFVFALTDAGEAVAARVTPTKVQAALRPAGGAWGSPTDLGGTAVAARVAMSPAGDAIVLAPRTPPHRVDAYFRPAGGAWGGVELVEDLAFAPTPGGSAVEFDPAGHAVALFADANGTLLASTRGTGGGWPANAEVLDDSIFREFVDGLVRHPGGVVALWRRQLTNTNFNPQLAVARWGGSWEAEKVYAPAPAEFTTGTVAADPSGEILVAVGRDEEIWGATVPSISAPWPASLERLTPASDATHRYRNPISAAGGGKLFVGFGVHGQPTDFSQVIATGACAGGGGSPPGSGPDPTPNPTPPPPGVPGAPQPPVSTPKTLPKLASFVALPSARRCVRARSFKLRVKPAPAGFEVAKITVRVNGKVAKVRRKGAVITLRKLPGRRFKLDVVVKLKDGRSVKGSRTFRPCG